MIILTYLLPLLSDGKSGDEHFNCIAAADVF